MLLETLTYLGPARVIAIDPLRVSVPDGMVSVLSALPYEYDPAIGDRVLVTGQEDRYYLLGILSGRGKIRFVAPGDLELSAPQGTVQIRSPHAIHMESPDIVLKASRLELIAKTVTEKFVNAYCWVKELFQFHSGRTRQTVDQDYRVLAGRIVEQAEEDVKIDGKKIQLG
jgi:hypothetical protein